MKYYKFSDPMDEQWYYICRALDKERAKEKYINYYDEPPNNDIVLEELDFSEVFAEYLKDVGMTKTLKSLIFKIPEVKNLVADWVKQYEEKKNVILPNLRY